MVISIEFSQNLVHRNIFANFRLSSKMGYMSPTYYNFMQKNTNVKMSDNNIRYISNLAQKIHTDQN